MSRASKMLKLEASKPKLIYPSFSDMEECQTRGGFTEFMLKNNPLATEDDIANLKVKNFHDMYKYKD